MRNKTDANKYSSVPVTYQQKRRMRMKQNINRSPYVRVAKFVITVIAVVAVLQLIICLVSEPVSEYIENLMINEFATEDITNFEKGDYGYDLR